jgi:hypothetical protein
MKLNRLFYLGTLIIVFFTIGLVLSNLINEIFPACDFQKNDKYLVGECAGQLVLIYLLFYLFQDKITLVIETIFKQINKSNLDTFSRLIILISFSSGIYKHLDELNKKTKYLKNKYF